MIMTKTVGELCKQIKGIYNLNGSADTVITGISSDSRQIERAISSSAFPVSTSMAPPLQPRLSKKGPSPS